MLPRSFTASDLAGVMRLSAAANWNQTEQDWLRILHLEPEGCFAIEADGRLVSTATTYCYGEELAWIGMVLTDPEYRGRGFAHRLMEQAVAFARRRGVRWIKLDATDMGRPLYARLGFLDQYSVERWMRPPAAIDPAPVDAFRFPASLDLQAFGADRSRLVESLAGADAASSGDAYAMGRSGSRAAYFGPCVARHPADAERLARWFLARHASQSICWDLMPDNAPAVDLARELGFAPLRRLTRMALPALPAPAIPEHRRLVYALAGFEYG
jgi:GNAT superfamily N-acetyltransferase